jgi:hypothetical protein
MTKPNIPEVSQETTSPIEPTSIQEELDLVQRELDREEALRLKREMQLEMEKVRGLAD